MENKEVIAVIILIIVVICAIVLPRWYYKTHSTIDTVAIVTAIYTAAALEIGVLGGLIMAFRK